MAKRTQFVHVKDAQGKPGAFQFLLPGDGTIDYQRYFALLKEKRYQGWILVEVSRQLQTVPGFDPLLAARKSYENLAPRVKAAGLRS